MKKEKLEDKIEYAGMLLFYTALVIELLIVIVDKSAFINPLESQLFRLTFLLCAAKILFTKYSGKEWLLMTAFVILGLLSYKVTGRNEILRVVAFIAASKNISLRKTLKLTFYITLSGISLLIVLSLFHVMGNISITAEFGRGVVETRYCLGIGHPNALHCMVFMIVLLGIYLYHKKMNMVWYAALFALNIGLFLLTDSKTGAAITAFVIVCAVLLGLKKYRLTENKWTYITGALLFVFAFLMAMGMSSMMGMSTGPFGRLDVFFTGRIAHSHWLGGAWKWTIFGNPEYTEYFDIGFMRLFYWYGVLPGTIYMLTNALQLWDCFKKKDAYALLILVSLAIYTVVEAHIISVYIGRNYMLLLLVGTWSRVFMVSDGKERYLWQLLKRDSTMG